MSLPPSRASTYRCTDWLAFSRYWSKQ